MINKNISWFLIGEACKNGKVTWRQASSQSQASTWGTFSKLHTGDSFICNTEEPVYSGVHTHDTQNIWKPQEEGSTDVHSENIDTSTACAIVRLCRSIAVKDEKKAERSHYFLDVILQKHVITNHKTLGWTKSERIHNMLWEKKLWITQKCSQVEMSLVFTCPVISEKKDKLLVSDWVMSAILKVNKDKQKTET